jgi:hypothetical protein
MRLSQLSQLSHSKNTPPEQSSHPAGVIQHQTHHNNDHWHSNRGHPLDALQHLASVFPYEPRERVPGPRVGGGAVETHPRCKTCLVWHQAKQPNALTFGAINHPLRVGSSKGTPWGTSVEGEFGVERPLFPALP